MKRRLKIAALIFGLFVLLVLSFLAWVIYTEAGLRFAVARLPEKHGQGHAAASKTCTARSPAASARDVSTWISERTHVRVEKGTARVNFWPLLVGRIAVRGARADLVQIEVKTPAPAAARHAAQVPAAPAQHQRRDAPSRTAWSSSRPTASAWSSPT